MTSNMGQSGESERDASLARQGKGFTVQASPFNAVKLDLALIVVVGVVLLVVNDHLTQNRFGQFLLMAGYGVAAMFWVVIKTRRIARRLVGENNGAENGEK